MRRLVAGLAFVVIAGGLILAVARGHRPAAAATRPGGGFGRPGAVTAVTVAPVRRGTLVAQLDLVGTVNAVDSVQVMPQASGRVAQLLADVGQRVQAGQVLARLDDDGAAASALAQAQAQLAQAQLQLQQMEDPAAFTSPTAVTQARLAVAAAQANVAQQQANLAAAQAQASVTAPGGGTVETVLVTVGQAVSQGQALMQVVAPGSPVLVLAQVPQTGVSVTPGQSVSVWIPAVQQVVAGSVTAVGAGAPPTAASTPAGSTAKGTAPAPSTTGSTMGTLAVTVTLANPPAGLRDGMTAQLNVTVPQPGTLPQTVQASGTIQFAQDWTVTAPAAAVVATLPVSPGDTVSPGQVVATLAGPALQTAIDRNQAALAQAEAQLAQAQASLQALLTPPPAATPTVAAQQVVVQQMQAAVALRQQQAAELVVRAPFAGTIQARNVAVGATVGPGTALFTLVGPGVEVTVPVPQEQVGQVHPGETAAILPGDGGPAVPGHVQVVAPGASPQSLAFLAYVVPDAPAPRLLPGAAARVVITTADVPDALVIPQQAVQTVGGRSQVYVVRDGVLALVPVQLGPAGTLQGDAGGTDVVQVLAGLPAGNQVVTSDATYLAPGDRVVVTGGGAPAGGAGGSRRGPAATATATPQGSGR